MTTLNDIAKAGGISVRTVRRALSNAPNVLPEKRAKILKLAEELNYLPDVNARNLRTRSSHFIGVIGFEAKRSWEVYTRKTFDLEKRLESQGFYPVMATVPENCSEAEKILKDWNGMLREILVMSPVTEEIAQTLLRGGNRFLWIDQDRIFPGSNLQVDRTSGIAEAIRFLSFRGRRRILHCGRLPSRCEAFAKILREQLEEKKTLPHAPPPEYQRVFCGSTSSEIYRASAALLEQRMPGSGRKADILFFDTDRMAFGFLKYAAEHGIRIPRDIAVVGFDDDAGSAFTYPSLSTVAHPYEELNARIIELIADPSRGEVRECLPTRFVPRESTGGGGSREFTTSSPDGCADQSTHKPDR